MVNPGNFHGTRLKFLNEQKLLYFEAVRTGSGPDCLSDIQRRFFKRYPVDFPNDEEPSPEALAAVDDDAADPEPSYPDEDSMTAEELAVATKAFEARRAKVKVMRERIRRWFVNRRPKSSLTTDSPMASLLAPLLSAPMKKKRQPIAFNVWAKAHPKEVEEAYRRRCLIEQPAKDKALAVRSAVAREQFFKLPQEVQDEWQRKVKEDHKAFLAEQEKQPEYPIEHPISRQQSIEGLIGFAQPFLEHICLHTGMKATLMVGGPEPADGGKLNVVAIHAGTTTGPVKVKFGESERADYKKFILPVYSRFLKKCYTPAECRSRALPGQHTRLADILADHEGLDHGAAVDAAISDPVVPQPESSASRSSHSPPPPKRPARSSARKARSLPPPSSSPERPPPLPTRTRSLSAASTRSDPPSPRSPPRSPTRPNPPASPRSPQSPARFSPPVSPRSPPQSPTRSPPPASPCTPLQSPTRFSPPASPRSPPLSPTRLSPSASPRSLPELSMWLSPSSSLSSPESARQSPSPAGPRSSPQNPTPAPAPQSSTKAHTGTPAAQPSGSPSPDVPGPGPASVPLEARQKKRKERDPETSMAAKRRKGEASGSPGHDSTSAPLEAERKKRKERDPETPPAVKRRKGEADRLPQDDSSAPTPAENKTPAPAPAPTRAPKPTQKKAPAPALAPARAPKPTQKKAPAPALARAPKPAQNKTASTSGSGSAPVASASAPAHAPKPAQRDPPATSGSASAPVAPGPVRAPKPAQKDTPAASGSSSAPVASSSASARSKPAQKDTPALAAVPAWLTSALKMLRSGGLGPQWLALVDAWEAFEIEEGFSAPLVLSPKGRPSCIADWIKRARSPNFRPAIPSLDEYATIYAEWWGSLQPDWRKPNPSAPLVRGPGDLGSVRKPGANGLLSVVAALFFWGSALGQAKRTAWLGAVEDVHWVLQQLTG